MAGPTLFSLEALNAEAGDCLLLHYGTKDDRQVVLIDGGPGKVYENHLRKRLAELRGDADEPFLLRLAMVSHIDDDHITGVRKLLKDQNDKGDDAVAEADAVWHNGIEDAEPADLAASRPPVEQLPTERAQAIAAGIAEGKKLGDLVLDLDLDGNPPFEGLVMQQSVDDEPIGLDDLTLRVLLPDQERLDGLWKEWRELLEDQAKRAREKKAKVAAFADDSLTNLASIVALATCGGKSILLTGDARGDHLEDAVRKAGLRFTIDEPLDVLKVPHHGSSANMEVSTFELLPARHYVFSADGDHRNPDIETLEMLFAARKRLGSDGFTLHFTNERMVFTDRRTRETTDIGKAVKAFLAKQKRARRKFAVNYREADAHSLVIDLLPTRLGDLPRP